MLAQGAQGAGQFRQLDTKRVVSYSFYYSPARVEMLSDALGTRLSFGKLVKFGSLEFLRATQQQTGSRRKFNWREKN